jgi:iron complex outermembrane recepter protein
MDFSTFPAPQHATRRSYNFTSGILSRISPEIKRKIMMRVQLLAVLLLAACLQISAAGFSQNITINEKNSSLETVLNKIEKQSGFDVFFQTELLAKSNKVTIDVKNMPLDAVLDKLFINQPLSYAIVGHTVVIKAKTVSNAGKSASALAGVVRGKVVDADTKEPLVGASILLKGTNVATSAGLDGSFKIDASSSPTPVLVISYIGYISQEVAVSGDKLGDISLKSNATGMNEVVINGDVAIDRKTPVAVTTVSAQYIEEHLGTQDIPGLLKGIPGVMATAQGGGYGDSRISIRGFSSRSGNGNVALTVNGIPINDPETGAIYWSDFSGITDVTNSIQVQRGLGASKIIIPSFGGTVNITTRSTDMQKGGFVSETIGSDGFDKTQVLASTGLTSSGWAATVQLGRTMGNGFADGLSFLGYNYFVNIAKQLTPNQTLSFNLIGANQTHGQRPEETIADYQQAPQGIKWNPELGVLNGAQINPYNNFFSEPIFSINHDWNINDKTSLATVLYGIFGDGGGGEISGTIPRVSNFYSPYDYTAASVTNANSADGSASSYLFDEHDNTAWYGLRSTLRTKLGKYIDLSAGIDLRYYEGTHYEEVTDLLGANYVSDNYYNYGAAPGNLSGGSAEGNINQPIHNAVVGDKINYYNEDYVYSGGLFAQAEYAKKDFTAFVTLSGSDQSQKRADFFNYLNNDPAQTSPSVSFATYQAKAGANYNINSQMNVFANIGYLTKPPYYGNVFEGYTNQINKNAITEKSFSYELGYGFKTSTFSANLNLYRTSYMDRAETDPYTDVTTNQLYTINISGLNELHQGAELELKYRPIKEILLGGALSLGDWYYSSNSGPAAAYDNTGQLVAGSSKASVDLKGLKLGDAAQTTFAGIAEFYLVKDLKFGAIFNYWGNYTAYVPFTDITGPNIQPYKIPNFATWDLSASLKFKMAGFDSELIGTVNNLLNTKYISDAEDTGSGAAGNTFGQAGNVLVYYGLGRTFTTGLKVRF